MPDMLKKCRQTNKLLEDFTKSGGFRSSQLRTARKEKFAWYSTDLRSTRIPHSMTTSFQARTSTIIWKTCLMNSVMDLLVSREISKWCFIISTWNPKNEILHAFIGSVRISQKVTYVSTELTYPFLETVQVQLWQILESDTLCLTYLQTCLTSSSLSASNTM